MKIGYLCESCSHFTESTGDVVMCPCCEKDMCNSCANDFLCKNCQIKEKDGSLYKQFKKVFEDGEFSNWERIDEAREGKR